nr:MAG TPA: hypothetical protein [Caudoviricetes sp.]
MFNSILEVEVLDICNSTLIIVVVCIGEIVLILHSTLNLGKL